MAANDLKALTSAAREGNLKEARALLRKGKEHAKDWKPIMDACFLGQAEMVSLLLKSGADPNVVSKTPGRHRPLHRTVEHKEGERRGPTHLETAKMLLEAGVDANLPGTFYMHTPLALAAVGGEVQFFPLLLKKTRKDIFTEAVLANAKGVSKLVAKDSGLATAESGNGWQALRYCAASRVDAGDGKSEEALLEIARQLLKGGADASGALERAISTNKADMVSLLLDNGAEVDGGDTLVHAAWEGNFQVLDTLADRGADLQSTIGTEHHGGYTPLGSLMQARSVDGARWFLERGIDPDHVDSDEGETALHVAVKYGCRVEMLELLTEFGVSVDARNASGQTALEVGVEKGRKKQVAYLEQAGGGIDRGAASGKSKGSAAKKKAKKRKTKKRK